ncbi:MAG: hypothetical protein ACRD36_13980, partial [Candidatus Acidiferrum sp.]
MRPLTQSGSKAKQMARRRIYRRPSFLSAQFLTAVAATTSMLGCGGGGSGSAVNPPSPPPAIVVTVTPASGSILLGNSQTFAATVTNTTDTSVTWSVNGIAGGSASTGTITSAGIYTAPADLPSQATVSVTATCHADATKFATAQVTITSDITIGLTPTSSGVELGATSAFHAAIASSGHPDATVLWSISGAACPSACGTVDGSGNYTAPRILPSPATATLTAQSVADPSKQASAAVTI